MTEGIIFSNVLTRKNKGGGKQLTGAREDVRVHIIGWLIVGFWILTLEWVLVLIGFGLH